MSSEPYAWEKWQQRQKDKAQECTHFECASNKFGECQLLKKGGNCVTAELSGR